jgi:serine/threonine protein kinase
MIALPIIGDEIAGRYKLLSLIATGGFGQVFLARHHALQSQVAIKLLHPTRASSPADRKRFLREARVVAELKHPHIVQIHDLGELEDGTLFISMEFIEGEPLSQLIHKGKIKPRLTVQVIRDTAVALTHAHNHQIVHRDLKPSNILLEYMPDKAYFVKLIDFGILKHLDKDNPRIEDGVSHTITQPTTLLGTPQYMAPEQIKGEKIDGRCDQYALAILAYELVFGTRPFDGRTPMEVIAAQLGNRPTPPGTVQWGMATPSLLQRVLARGMAQDPQDRYLDTRQFANAFEAAMRPIASRTEIIVETPVALPPPDTGFLNTAAPSLSTAAYAPSNTPRRGWLLAIGAAIVMGVLAFAWNTPFDNPDDHTKLPLTIPHSSQTSLLPQTPPLPTQSTSTPHAAPVRLPATETYLPMPSLAPIRPFPLANPPRAMKNKMPARHKEDRSNPALITVVTRPTGDIQIDGVSYGDMGVYNLKLPPGHHTIRASREGSPNQKKRIRLKAGRSYQVRFDMENENISFEENP